jgi:hypothetical protein
MIMMVALLTIKVSSFLFIGSVQPQSRCFDTHRCSLAKLAFFKGSVTSEHSPEALEAVLALIASMVR